MRHIVAIVFAGFIAVVSSSSANAQAVLCAYCCDYYGNPRCAMVNEVPCGNQCFCYGQGYGNAC